jgi:hypothetical protein
MELSEQPHYLRFAPAICIGILLFFTFRLYGYSYFWLDDFNNLHWIQQWSLWQGIRDVLSPSTEHFRPVGLLAYQIAFKLFGRDARFYHALMWAIHTLNVMMVYTVLKRFTESRPGAAVGAMLFASTPVFNDIFWSFGTIFELTGLPLFLAGMLLWQRNRRSVAVVLGATAVFILAIKAKEVAITLPAIWLAQDLLLRRPWKWKDAAAFLLPILVCVWFGLQKAAQMRAADPSDPYYMDLRGIVVGRGFAYYFNRLFQTELKWQIWSIGFVVVLLILLALKWRLAAFFQVYVFLTFMPLIFLVNHRFTFYWYFPMLGVCGLAALVVKAATEGILRYVPAQRLAPYACLGFSILCAAYYVYFHNVTEGPRQWGQQTAADFRELVDSLQALPPPGKGETLFFNSLPEYFDAGTLQCAAEFALQRFDFGVRVVKEFPLEAHYRLHFENSRAIMQP